MDNQPLLFDNNPELMKDAIGKQIDVKTVEDKLITGVLFAVDPDSHTLVIVNRNQSTTVNLVTVQAIKSLDIGSEAPTQEFLLKNEEPNRSYENERKRVYNWLKQNLIDVVEDGNLLKYEDYLTIEPPYGPDQCLCHNTIILERIRKIISSMPH